MRAPLTLDHIETALNTQHAEADVAETMQWLRDLVAIGSFSTSRPIRVTKSEIREIKKQLDIFARVTQVNEKLNDGDVDEAAKYILDVLCLDYGEYL